VLECYIETITSRQEAQNLPSVEEEAGFTTTDAFKVPDENNAVAACQDYEIATIPGDMRYRKKS
jgi:hypothetical protein